MELNLDGVAVNLSGMDERNYQLNAIPHVFKTLYSSMYENKEQVVLSELAANGLDAQRENGTQDIPVKIELPTKLVPELVVTDCGIGMDLDTLQNLYTVYGASTKRGDNEGIGGFGFGSKSPFSIADSFTVESTHEGITTHVANYIDNGMPKFVVYSSEHTGKPSGTTVRVPVTDDEIMSRLQRIASYLYSRWTVKPEILRMRAEFSDRMASAAATYESEKYIFIPSHSPDPRVQRQYFDSRVQTVQVGPFLYRIPSEMTGLWDEVFKKNTNLQKFFDEMHRYVSDTLCLVFNIGELELSPTRERIEDTPENRKVLRERYEEVINSVASRLPEWGADEYRDWIEHAVKHVVLDSQGRFVYFPPSIVDSYFDGMYGDNLDCPLLRGWVAYQEASECPLLKTEIWDILKVLDTEPSESVDDWVHMPRASRAFYNTRFPTRPLQTFNYLNATDAEYATAEIFRHFGVEMRGRRLTRNNVVYPPIGYRRGNHTCKTYAVLPQRVWPLFGKVMEHVDEWRDEEIQPITTNSRLPEAIAMIQAVNPAVKFLLMEEVEALYRSLYVEHGFGATRAVSDSRKSAKPDPIDVRDVGYFQLPYIDSLDGRLNRVVDTFYGARYKEEPERDLLVIVNGENPNFSCITNEAQKYPDFLGKIAVVYVSSRERQTVRFSTWADKHKEVVEIPTSRCDYSRRICVMLSETETFKETVGKHIPLANAAYRLFHNNRGQSIHNTAEYILGTKFPYKYEDLVSLADDDHYGNIKGHELLPFKLQMFLSTWYQAISLVTGCLETKHVDELLLKKDIAELRRYAFRLGKYAPPKTPTPGGESE